MQQAGRKQEEHPYIDRSSGDQGAVLRDRIETASWQDRPQYAFANGNSPTRERTLAPFSRTAEYFFAAAITAGSLCFAAWLLFSKVATEDLGFLEVFQQSSAMLAATATVSAIGWITSIAIYRKKIDERLWGQLQLAVEKFSAPAEGVGREISSLHGLLQLELNDIVDKIGEIENKGNSVIEGLAHRLRDIEQVSENNNLAIRVASDNIDKQSIRLRDVSLVLSTSIEPAVERFESVTGRMESQINNIEHQMNRMDDVYKIGFTNVQEVASLLQRHEDLFTNTVAKQVMILERLMKSVPEELSAFVEKLNSQTTVLGEMTHLSSLNVELIGHLTKDMDDALGKMTRALPQSVAALVKDVEGIVEQSAGTLNSALRECAIRHQESLGNATRSAVEQLSQSNLKTSDALDLAMERVEASIAEANQSMNELINRASTRLSQSSTLSITNALDEVHDRVSTMRSMFDELTSSTVTEMDQHLASLERIMNASHKRLMERLDRSISRIPEHFSDATRRSVATIDETRDAISDMLNTTTISIMNGAKQRVDFSISEIVSSISAISRANLQNDTSENASHSLDFAVQVVGRFSHEAADDRSTIQHSAT